MALVDYKAGDRVTAFAAVRRVERREYNGKPYVTMNVGDKTGSVNAVMWEGFEAVVDRLRPGVVVKIQGTMGDFRDQPQIRLERLRIVQENEYDLADLIPASAISREELAARLDQVIASVADTDLRRMLEIVFADGPTRERFLRSPGGQRWHHAYIGGLAEHTLGVIDLCEFCAGKYPELDRDLLICGAVLHDIGKIEQYTISAVFEYTDAGRLVGHVVQGDEIVRAALGKVDGFPEEKAMRLRHLILSHQGQLEFQSPVVPMTREAFVLHYADDLDSKLGALRKLADKAGGAPWSEWVKLLDRFIYFGTTAGSPGDREQTGAVSADLED